MNGTTENTNITDSNKGNEAVNKAINTTESVTINETPRNTTEKRIHNANVNEIKNVTKAVINKTKRKNSVKKFKSPSSKNSK